MLTLIHQSQIKTMIKFSGEAIRTFLSTADANRFKGEANLAIKAFRAKPSDFTDKKLVAYGKGAQEAINNPVRIEVRGLTKDGAAQMVAKGVWGLRRELVADELSRRCKALGYGLHIKLAGKSSLEFNVMGVDKSLPILFLRGSFDQVLKEMDYQPGPRINSFISRTVIAADGDGTIYDGPRVGRLPTLNGSPVKEALVAYVQAGGIFMLVSGNEIQRTLMRLLDGLPAEVYGRILIAANGGAELVYVNSKGKPVAISNYKSQALQIAQHKKSHQSLDMVYIGDDGSIQGNDYPAFKAVGFNRSVLVAPEFLAKFDPALKASYIKGSLQGTRQFLEKFLADR